MGMVYLDDRFPEHPKVIAAGDAAAWMFVCGLGYAARHDYQPTVPREMVTRLTGAKNAGQLAKKLVAVGLWHDFGDHYEIHDYAFWNNSAIERSDRARKAARTRWGTSKPDTPAHAQASVEHVPNRPTSTSPNGDSAHALAMPYARPSPTPTPTPKNQTPVLEFTHDQPGPSPENRDSDVEKPGANQAKPDDPLLGNLERICTAKHRQTVRFEAIQVLSWALGHVDRRVIDEAIGYAGTLEPRPVLPRMVAVVIERRATENGIAMPEFVPIGRVAS